MARKGGFPRPIAYIIGGLILLNLLSGLASDPDFAEDFPLFAAIGAFLLFRFFMSRSGKRRGPVPMPMPTPQPEEQPQDLGFKIPPLRGAPKDAQAEAREAESEEEAARLAMEFDARQKKQQRQEAEAREQAAQAKAERAARGQQLSFSPDALRNAVIWSEIFAPPKALRKK